MNRFSIYLGKTEKEKSRHDLAVLTGQLCEALKHTKWESYLQNIIAFILQYLSYREESILPGPPEMEILGTMLESEYKIAYSAEVTLKLIGTLPAKLLLSSHLHNTKIHSNLLNWDSFSQGQALAVQVYQNGELKFSTYIKREDGKYSVDFPEEMWNTYIDVAPLVLETTSVVLQSFLDEQPHYEMMQDMMNENREFQGASEEEVFGDIDSYNQWAND